MDHQARDRLLERLKEDADEERSPTGHRTYRAWRVWDRNRPVLSVVLDRIEDNRLKDVAKIAKDHGYGGILACGLHESDADTDGRRHLVELARTSDVLYAGWTDPVRGRELLRWLVARKILPAQLKLVAYGELGLQDFDWRAYLEWKQ